MRSCCHSRSSDARSELSHRTDPSEPPLGPDRRRRQCRRLAARTRPPSQPGTGTGRAKRLGGARQRDPSPAGRTVCERFRGSGLRQHPRSPRRDVVRVDEHGRPGDCTASAGAVGPRAMNLAPYASDPARSSGRRHPEAPGRAEPSLTASADALRRVPAGRQRASRCSRPSSYSSRRSSSRLSPCCCGRSSRSSSRRSVRGARRSS